MNVRSRATKWALRSFAVLICAWLIAPVLIMIPLAFSGQQSFKFPPDSYSTRWFSRLFGDSSWNTALTTSVTVALIVVAIVVVLGTACAIGLDRSTMRGKGLARGFIIAPMIVPVVITGVGIYIVALRTNQIGTTAGFVLAHVGLALPFVVIAVSVSLSHFDRRLELAAASLGASPLITFFKITLPMILPGVLGGAAFAFITSLDEVVVSLFLSNPFKRTIPVKMFQTVQDIDPTIAAASVLMLAATTILVLVAFFANQTSRRAAGLVG